MAALIAINNFFPSEAGKIVPTKAPKSVLYIFQTQCVLPLTLRAADCNIMTHTEQLYVTIKKILIARRRIFLNIQR